MRFFWGIGYLFRMELLEPVRLAEQDWKAAGQLLSRAFFDNPGMVWALPDPTKRPQRLSWLLGTAMRLCCRAGEGWCFPGVVGGIAGWLPPGRTQIGYQQMLSVGFALAPLRVGMAGCLRTARLTDILQKIHHQAEPADHWYLYAIGVEPKLQGQGYGSRLMRQVLDRVDTDKQRCYLETDKPEDVAFYQKHGFQVRSEFPLLGKGPKLWTMSREARS